MISLKKYLDSASSVAQQGLDEDQLLSLVLAAYSTALLEMGHCSLDACPGLGDKLKERFNKLQASLNRGVTRETIEFVDRSVQEQLQSWGREAARHYNQKAGEVRELLIVMARTAEAVGERDQRCAGQITAVTARLKEIGSLDDLTEIRASIEKNAAELKTSIERMTAEGTAAIAHLRKQVSTYQTKLDEAEVIASRDSLTGLSSRHNVEEHIQSRINLGTIFSVAIVDIDQFKRVNDSQGHLVGDELLKQFAIELKSAFYSAKIIGRWGGDEFILVFDCNLAEAIIQSQRLDKWVCGSYQVQGRSGAIKLQVDASIGLAEYRAGESMADLLVRADDAMYQMKAVTRPGEVTLRR